MISGVVPAGRLGASLRALLLVAAALLAGCATVQPTDPRDPYEGFNRAMFSFNEGFDDAIGKPVATVWKEVLPLEIRVRVRNFFSNIQDVMIGVNNLLQGKPAAAADDLARVVINTSLGLAGLHDIASEAGLDKHNEDFGQTFAVWGMEEGPYFVWPFIGPNTARDTLGFAFDIIAAPVRWVPVHESTTWWLAGLYLVNERADLLDVTTTLDEAAIDKYLQRRDAYFQRRRNLIYDGNPPRERPPRLDQGAAPGTPAPRAGSKEGVVIAADQGLSQ